MSIARPRFVCAAATVTLPSVAMPARLNVVCTLAKESAVQMGLGPPNTVALRSPEWRVRAVPPGCDKVTVPARDAALRAAPAVKAGMIERAFISVHNDNDNPAEAGFL